MKKCFKCNETKPLSEFYKHKQMGDGHLNKCKVCARADTNKQRNEVKPEYYRAYDRARATSEKRRAWRLKRQRADRAADPLANTARRKVAYAVRAGKLTKQPCWCSELKVEAHHPDYNEPLNVIWLCNKHHKHIHGRKAL
jgi:hypothetical protein